MEIKYHDYIVSSDGFVINKNKNKIGYLDKTTNIFKIKITIEGKKKILNLHSLIVELFVPEAKGKKYKIFHLDNNPLNCSINNLKIVYYINENLKEISNETLEIFYSFDIYKYCYSYIYKHNFLIDHVLFTVDDIVQDMVFYIYKRLYLYDKFSNLPFVAFVEMLSKKFRLKQFEKATAEKNKLNLSLDYIKEKCQSSDFIENKIMDFLF